MININNITALAETLPVETEVDGYTGYGVWKVYKEVFTQLGLDVTKTSQSVYNDLVHGRIDGIKNTHRITDETVIETYVAKLVARATR